MSFQCWDVPFSLVGVILVSSINANAYPSYNSVPQGGTGECDLFASYVSSIDKLVRQYCYKCEDNILTNTYNQQKCVNPKCLDQKFEVIENGVTAYYKCFKSCSGPPLACNAPTPIDNVDWTCSEDIELQLTPRKFLACQTCLSVCPHGYQQKQKETISCEKINSTHMGWNTTEIKPSCISITKICGTPDIAGVTLEDCVIYSNLDSLTHQYSFHQECTARCDSGLHQVHNVNTSCGEDGNWSNLDRLEKMCIDPSQGCKLPSGSWNCTGIWFNSSLVSSGASCHLDCGHRRTYRNALLCNNTQLFRLYKNLQHPFCIESKFT